VTARFKNKRACATGDRTLFATQHHPSCNPILSARSSLSTAFTRNSQSTGDHAHHFATLTTSSILDRESCKKERGPGNQIEQETTSHKQIKMVQFQENNITDDQSDAMALASACRAAIVSQNWMSRRL
jgi:hypothetical protein